MKMELRSIVAGAACAWLLAGCGGGGSNSGNSPDDSGETPSTFLEVSAASLPDDALRACVNRLAEENRWQTVADVDVIICGDVEIRSIKGLQQFPGLRTLKIAAPRLPVEEIPLLAELPLADYERKPFYLLNDESSADNVEPGMKQLLMDGNVSIASDQAITYVVLLADDPRNPDRLDWHSSYSHDYSPTSSGSLRVGQYVTLHWVQEKDEDESQFSLHPSYSREEGPGIQGHFSNPRRMAADQPITQLSSLDAAFKDCVQDNAAQHGWTSTWQVTSLDCANRNIELAYGMSFGIENFPKLEYLDLRGNPAIANTRFIAYQTDATVLVADTALEPPQVELRECGLYIANYDSMAEYNVWKIETESRMVTGVPYDLLGVPHPLIANPRLPENWQPGSSPQCMSIEGRGVGVWVVEVARDGARAGAELFPVTNADGEWVQHLVDDRKVEPLMFLPGLAGPSLYALKAGKDHYEVQQVNASSWQQGARHRVDRLPYLATNDGIYLFPARSDDAWQRKDGALLHENGRVEELPPRPVGGRPKEVIEADGEIWLTGLQDEWGPRPEVLAWNPQSRQWRVLPGFGTTRYSANLSGDELCVRRIHIGDEKLCWNRESQQWMPESNAASVSKYHQIRDYRYTLKDEIELYRIIEIFFGRWLPSNIADGRDWMAYRSQFEDVFFLTGNDSPAMQIYLAQRRIGSEEDAFVDFIHAGLPMNMQLYEQDDQMLAIYNDSVARYPLPPAPSSAE